MSKVFLAAVTSSDSDETMTAKIEALWQQADLGRTFKAKDLAALKLHVGEPGLETYVAPRIVAALVRLMEASGTQPFLTDTAVLYKSPRNNGPGHVRVAHEHGFTIDQVGAPFIPGDGLSGLDAHDVAVEGKHYQKVAIASAILQARSMLVLSHATGHLATGLGGALKNLGMGCASRAGKLRQHYGQQPRINADTCTACAVCVGWCPAEAITVDEQAVIDGSRCIGCGECIAACQEGAIDFDWGITGKELQERIVEHAAAVVNGRPERICYVTVALNITKHCDCLGIVQEPLLPDIGILASFDPVAIDQAVLDLVISRSGNSLESMSFPDRDGTEQITYAESLGLGERAVELVLLD